MSSLLQSTRRRRVATLAGLLAATLLFARPIPAVAQTFELLNAFHESERTPSRPYVDADGTVYGTAEWGSTGGQGVLFKITPSGTYVVLHKFSGPDGGAPRGVIKGSDGAFYGTTAQGGANGAGTIFKWDGSGLTTLHSFNSSEGSYPYGSVIQASDGALYGTLQYGGPNGYGTIFKWDGSLTTLHSFDYYSNGGYPWAGVIQGSDGALYGTALIGGPNGCGTLFRFDTSFTVLHAFAYATGCYPYGRVMQASDGKFYGTTWNGGANGYGTIYQWDGSTHTALHSFSYSGNSHPHAGLVQDANGDFYGTTYYSSGWYYGTIFKWNGASLTTLRTFSGTDGAYPQSELAIGPDGLLYGATQWGGANWRGNLFRLATDGSGFTSLHQFPHNDLPWHPSGGVVRDPDGTLYTTTVHGGGNNQYGTLIKRAPDGTITTLHAFDYTTGAYPYGRLARGSDGAIYGTTSYGGANGRGTIFKWDGSAFAVVHSFGWSDGAYPFGGVTLGADGALYGTTHQGGASGVGTIFRWNGSLTTLHSFAYTDGGYPWATVTQGSDGALYGTTLYGGSSGSGTLFKFDSTLTTLHNFDWTTGAYPYAGVVQTSDGTLFGTTQQGGGSYYYGTLYKWNGSLTTLHSFDYYANGAYPFAGLALGDDGTVFGTTLYGGANGNGTVFAWNGALSTLHSFAYWADGYYPQGPLTFSGGALYGSTFYGGAGQLGTLFRITFGPVLDPTTLAASGAGTYGGTATLTATLAAGTSGVAGRTVEFSLNGSPVGTAVTDAGGVATLGGVSLAGIDAGTHTGVVSASFVADAEYDASSAAGDLVVAQASLVAAAQDDSRVYGAPNPTLGGTLTGVLAGDGITVSYTTTAVVSSPVGGYPITPVLSDPSSRLANYAVTLTPGTLTVTQAPLTVAANDKTKVYGDANPALDGVLSGVMAGDDITATYATTATASSGAGGYPITPTLVDPDGRLSNYSVTSTNGTLTISTRPLTITADDKSMILNAAVPGFTASYAGFAPGDSPATLDVPVALASSGDGTAPGSFAITASGAADPNYAITHVNGTLAVQYSLAACLGDLGHTVLQPINADGTSVFRSRSTVPVKFRVCDANGVSIGSAGVVTGFTMYQRVAGTVTTDVNEAPISTTPDTTFRWDAAAQQWIFNLNTRGLSTSTTYRYRIDLNDGTAILFQFGVR